MENLPCHTVASGPWHALPGHQEAVGRGVPDGQLRPLQGSGSSGAAHGLPDAVGVEGDHGHFILRQWVETLQPYAGLPSWDAHLLLSAWQGLPQRCQRSVLDPVAGHRATGRCPLCSQGLAAGLRQHQVSGARGRATRGQGHRHAAGSGAHSPGHEGQQGPQDGEVIDEEEEVAGGLRGDSLQLLGVGVLDPHGKQPDSLALQPLGSCVHQVLGLPVCDEDAHLGDARSGQLGQEDVVGHVENRGARACIAPLVAELPDGTDHITP